MPAGRPTKYCKELLEKAAAYVDSEFMTEGQLVPTVEGMALYVDCGRRTLYDWAADEEKEEFSRILEKCNAKQAVMLMSGALGNDMNANIAKLMLGKQGYSEKSIQEVTGANGGAIKTENKVEWVVQPVKPLSSDEKNS